MKKKKLVVIPSGSNLSLFKPLLKEDCRASLGLEYSKYYIGFIGSLLLHQGVDILIDAAPIIINTYPSTVFIIVGEGPCKKAWIEQASKKKVNESFRFLGEIEYERLPEYIGAMDICVAPLLDSAGLRSPAKIFDYLACGRPVIASRISGTTDIFESSGAVRLVPAGKFDLLAEAAIELIKDEERAKRMGQNARLFVEKKYDRLFLARKVVDEVNAFRKKKAVGR